MIDTVLDWARARVSYVAARWLFARELHRQEAPMGRRHPYRVAPAPKSDEFLHVEAWLCDRMGHHGTAYALRQAINSDAA